MVDVLMNPNKYSGLYIQLTLLVRLTDIRLSRLLDLKSPGTDIHDKNSVIRLKFHKINRRK